MKKNIDVKLMANMLNQAYNYLNEEVELINGLNVFPVPDGDTGTNMAATLKNAVDVINNEKYEDVDKIVKAFSKGALMGARGNSGVILSQIFGGFSKGIDKSVINIDEFSYALTKAAEQSYKAVMKPVEGTILTVIKESAEAVSALDTSKMSLVKYFENLIEISEKSLDNTPNLLPILKKSGVVDSGGRGLISIFYGFLSAVKGEKVKISKNNKVKKAETHFGANIEPADIKYSYCTEFIIRANKSDNSELKDKIMTFGDSVVFVQEDDIVKIHVHTNHPGDALETALKYGIALHVKVDNMKVQHDTIMGIEHEPGEDFVEEKNYGIVSVCSGEGFYKLFKEFGVDEIIEGGQTMNPSTEDILEKVNKIKADTVFILPNNKNILMSAKQAADISDKNVIVIETKTVPQGIGAVMVFDLDESVEENTEVMNEALEIDTIQITYSVRNTKLNGFAIKEKDFMCIKNGKIIAVEKTAEKALRKSLENFCSDYEMITVYVGEDGDENKAKKLIKDFSKKHEDIEAEIYSGKQPIYNYLIALE